ncbi:MAG: NAD(P)H-binding protein [Inquilinus limosus]|uniref:NAD(P)H-binding protein n=1 Tax=Inquilinus limosus TaxID=171674 RepID=A0A952KED0_9PROT|nr:NAD(P)H-binding protein [Inquilinus limosus]
MQERKPILVVGGTGKTGRRVAERLAARGIPVRIGSRSANPAFDWEDPSGWAAALDDAGAVYITYYPDLAAPGAPEAIHALVDQALKQGVRRLVLLSGRGEEEAQRAEQVLQDSGADWTIVRASWFSQNFSESVLLEGVLAGEIVLPAGDVGEPFIDADAEATAEIARAIGRPVRYTRVPAPDFAAALAEQGSPAEVTELLLYLFTTVLDGRNASLADGVQRALGRPPKDFADYARDTAASGAWAG